MKYRTAITVVIGAMLAMSSVSVNAEDGRRGGTGDRDQQMDRDREYDRDRDRTQDLKGPDSQDRYRDRDRLHNQDPMTLKDKDIYGSELMSPSELNQYREQLASKSNRQLREQYQVQHENRMQDRAKKQGKDLVPPGQGSIYGSELMTVEERNRYREQLRKMDSEKERLAFQAQHREKMDARSKALELEIE